MSRNYSIKNWGERTSLWAHLTGSLSVSVAMSGPHSSNPIPSLVLPPRSSVIPTQTTKMKRKPK